MSWSEIKKKKEEEEKRQKKSNTSNTTVNKIANEIRGSVWKQVGQGILTSQRMAEERKKQEGKTNNSKKQSNNVATFQRTVRPSAIQELSSTPNSVRVMNKGEAQKIVNPDSLWEKIKALAGDVERIDQNIGEGISNGLKDLFGVVYRARQKEMEERNKSLSFGGNTKIDTILKQNVDKARENVEDFDTKRREEKAKSQKKIEENISKQSNAITKKIAELSPSIGNMGIGMGVSAVNPIAGAAYFTGSAAGSYYYDALDRGMTREQADRYGKIMGSLEGLTEMIGVKNIQKGGKIVKTLVSGGGKTALKAATSETVKTGTKEALKNFGIGVADNFMQESIMEPLQELTAQTTGGKDKANWENMGKRMLQSGIDGALTSIIMSGAEAGSNTCIGLAEKAQKGKKITQQEAQQAVKDAEKVGVDTKKVAEENLLRERDKIINEMRQSEQNQNVDSKIINQETKTPQNATSQAETQAKTQTSSNLDKVRQFYDENTFNQMKQFIETAPSQEALNQINEDIKTETKNKLEEVYKSERFTESQSRKKTYAQYQRQNNTTGIQYNNDVVNNALDAVAANRNGRRTVGQWKQVAEQIGLEASNLSKAEIDNIAYGSWFDLQPTKNITRYDNRTKEHKSFEKFTSDDWINTIYESAKEQKLQKLDTELNQEQYSLSEVQPQNNFEYKQSNNTKIDTFRQDASNYWDNSEKTSKLVNTVEKIINDKGYNIRLDDTIGDNVNGRIRTNQDTGEIEITINPNSNRVGEFIIGHELTHAIETPEMVKLIKKRMQKDGDLRNAVEDLKKLYNTDEINAEVLADISGQLFGNQEFINNLSMEQPSIFKRIYDKIVSLANKITGNSSEALFIKDLKNKWEKAYRENTNNIKETQYSMQGEKSKIADKEALKRAKEMYNEYKSSIKDDKSLEEFNEKVFKETGWFIGAEGLWRSEISNKNARIETNLKGKDLKFRNDYEKEFVSDAKEKIRLAENQDRLNFWKNELEYSSQNLKVIDKINLDLKNLESFKKAENLKVMTNRIYLPDILKGNDELFEAYPFLSEIEIGLPFKDVFNNKETESGTLGYVERSSFDDIPKKIFVTKKGLVDNYGLKKIFLHEIQHAIQSYEGFSNGADIEGWQQKINREIREKINKIKAQEKKNFTNKEGKVDANFGTLDTTINKLIETRIDLYNLKLAEKQNNADKISKILTTEGYFSQYAYEKALHEGIDKAENLIRYYSGEKLIEKIDNIYSDIIKSGTKAFKLYKNTAGEIEAREVEKRAEWSDEKRKSTLPFIKNRNTVYFENYLGDYKKPKSMLTKKVENSNKSSFSLEFKKDIANKFEELTGDSIRLAGAKLAGIEIRNNMRQNGNLDGELETNPYSKEAMDLYNKYQNSKKTSSYLYHATGIDRLNSIIKNGLTTGNKQNQEGVSSTKEIYLSANPELAEMYANRNSVTLRINPKFYDKFENFRQDYLGGTGSYAITNNIPPEMLQIKENNKWVNLLESKQAKQIKETNQTVTQDNQGRKLSKGQQERYKDVSDKIKDEDGNIKRFYHGTQRGDRVGNIFDADKATSGPMAFFTDNQEIAKSYSENKTDTSLSREYSTEWDLFKANNEDLDSYWRSLSYEQKQEMREKGSEVGFDDDYELRFEKGASKESFGSHYEYELRSNGNNPIKALYDTFINGGYWMGEDIGNFKKVLDYIGVEDTSYLDPYKSESKVYEVYLNLKNPFDTSEISKEMLNKFEEASKKVNYNEEEAYSADMWDKTNVKPEDWIEYLKEDIENGTTHSWTRIPDWVTDVLKAEGYDGIVDTGGKHGGQSHQVAIPFYSEQIKNIDNEKPTDNPDIRYSKQNNNWQGYLESNYKSEGTTTDLRDIRLPMKEKQEVKLPVKENVQQTQENTQNTKGETINWNEIERPENNQKFRKHYRSIIESNQTTAEAKSIARDLMGTDTYTPETNKGQLAQADQRIMASSPETELQSLLSRVMNGEKISSVDIAVGERLIQYFSKTGNKQQLQEAIQATAMAGTSAGQTVQALSMLNHQTPQGQATWIQRSVDKMNKELAKRKGGTITTDVDGNLQVINKQGQDITNKVNLFNLTPEMIDKIMNSENQEQMYKNIDEVYEELGKQVPQSMLEKIDSWRYFSMLANARTHIRNMVGNVAMGKMQRVKDKIAGGIEDVVSKFNPDMERTKTLAIASKKTRDFVKQDFKNMEVQSRLELNENKYNPQSRLQNARRTFKSDGLENTLGRLFNLNDKLLSAEDGIGLKAGYQKALADYITANKIDVDNITDAQLGKARNYAIQQAKEATFHQASAIASAITQFQNKNKATKFFVDALLPFKKTPINIAKAGMEYSPLQIAKSATLDVVNLRKGNISINQYIDNLAKGMTGTGIALVGYALANAGILKASGGDDKDKEKFDEEQGKQSYSIEIAGKTYSLDWLAPTGIPLFIGAETFKLYSQEDTEKSTEKSSEEDRLNQAIKGASNLLNAGATAINPMSEMSMISGLTSALSSYNTSDNLGSLGNMMTNMGKSYVNQFFPTLMGQVAKTGDEYERTTKSTAKGTIGKAVDQTINQIKAKVPGLRQTLPIKTDIWGKEVKQEVNLPLRAINNFVNPATVKQVSTDKVDMELNKLYEENHNSSILPDILTKTVQLNKQTYRLNNKEYAEFTKNYGQTSHQLIEDFIKTSDYDRLTQEQKETAISNIYSYAKEQNKLNYAEKVNEEVKPSTLYSTMKAIEKGGGKQSEYLSYLAKTKGMSKESEKNKVLANSSYSNKTKEIIYTNGTGKDDDLYNDLLSKSNINMTEYLNYKNKASDKAFNADKDKNGKTITGSGKKKVIEYLNNNITGVGNRLLIAGNSYVLQNSEKQKLAQYINQIAATREERLNIYKQLDKNFIVKDGKVYMKVSKK